MENLITASGFKSIEDFAVKVVLPLLGLTVGLFFASILLLTLPFWVPYAILAAGFTSIVIVPVILLENKKMDIQENIHLFITYAGTIATIDVDRATFFRKVSENSDYGYISYYSY